MHEHGFMYSCGPAPGDYFLPHHDDHVRELTRNEVVLAVAG
ncbi:MULTISPECIES: hypothetical protein [Streptomyces]|nr:hypothetical protein [Streptomyces sp. A1-5]